MTKKSISLRILRREIRASEKKKALYQTFGYAKSMRGILAKLGLCDLENSGEDIERERAFTMRLQADLFKLSSSNKRTKK